MSHLPTGLGAPDVKPAASAGSLAPCAAAPVLISERQVVFSTAAARHRPIHRRWKIITLFAALDRIRSGLLEPRAHYRRHEPAYLEAARMLREMDRL